MASARAQVDWVRVPVAPELLQKLNQTSDLKGWLQAGGHLLLTLLTGAGVIVLWYHELWYWLVPALAAHGCICGMLGSGVHELVHDRVFTTRACNRFFLWVNSFLTHWNCPFFEISHKDHHRYTLNQPHDLEVVLPAAEVLAEMKPETRWQLCKRYCQYYFAWSGIVPTIQRHWVFARGSYPHNDQKGGLWSQVWCEHLFARMTDDEKRAIRDFSRQYLALHGLIIVVSLATGWWIVPLVTTFAAFFGGVIAFWTGGPQHAGLVDGVNDFRLCCRTYTCNWFCQFLYWNMNYHIEHHMYAAVPCYNLPKLHAAIKPWLPPIHTSLYGTWAEIRQIEFRQRFEPDYQYTQPLPEDLPGNGHLRLERLADASATAYLDLTDTTPAAAVDPDVDWKVWECTVCGFVYDEAQGMPEENIAPGTRWDDIPDDWACPDCGVAKADFRMIERARVETTAANHSVPTADDAAKEAADADTAPLVIVGSGMAGYSLAREFRRHNQEQKVLLLTRDGGENYSKPMLSNALAREKTPQALISKRAEEMARELDVDVRTGVEVNAIDRTARTITTTAGSFRYSRLVLATGADQRPLSLTGDAADTVMSVNDLADYQRFRSQLPNRGHVIILGAGLIGCEFANDLIDNDYRVTVLDLAELPLGALVPEEVGNAVRERLTTLGVHWRFGVSVTSVDRHDDALRCTLSDGSRLDGDLVLSAVGLAPRVELARAAGLEVSRGIVTNAALRTSDPNIYALGDCSEVGQQVRLFVAPLRLGAVALARTLAGDPTHVDYPPMPVLIKTPACPVVTLRPDDGINGSWRVVDADHDGIECHFVDADDQLRGFTLTEAKVARQQALLQRLVS
jgi:rubredoxin-NAD+ reductase